MSVQVCYNWYTCVQMYLSLVHALSEQLRQGISLFDTNSHMRQYINYKDQLESPEAMYALACDSSLDEIRFPVSRTPYHLSFLL